MISLPDAPDFIPFLFPILAFESMTFYSAFDYEICQRWFGVVTGSVIVGPRSAYSRKRRRRGQSLALLTRHPGSLEVTGWGSSEGPEQRIAPAHFVQLALHFFSCTILPSPGDVSWLRPPPARQKGPPPGGAPAGLSP